MALVCLCNGPRLNVVAALRHSAPGLSQAGVAATTARRLCYHLRASSNQTLQIDINIEHECCTQREAGARRDAR
jgi:hypothetical protein